MRLLPILILLALPMVARADAPITFEKDVRPILKAHCFHCHGEEEKPKAKLDVRLPSLLFKGGHGGSAIILGKPNESLLIEKVESGEMPEGKKKLSPAEITVLRRWIEQGAKTARPEPKDPAAWNITDEERAYWAFQPIRKPIIPQATGTTIRNPIDAFIAAKQQEHGLTFAPLADRRTLIRRVSMDLVGLPPTPEEIDAFVNDPAPDAYEQLIDRLLASPRYGERWGRHWLDVAGYADSDGVTTRDPLRPYAFMYRDYVIRSFNTDKPWNEFIREQLAGDEMVPTPHKDLTPEQIDRLAATGFLRMAPDGTASPEIANALLERNQTVAESLKIVSTALLGLTVGCAQCHDHRYDPITQVDYYRFRAIFDPAYNVAQWRGPAQRLVNVTPRPVQQQREAIEAEAKVVDDKIIQRLREIHEAHKASALQDVPEARRAAVKEAVDTPLPKRTDAHKAIIKEFPFADVLTRERGLEGFLGEYDGKYKTKFRVEIAELRKQLNEIRARKQPEEMVAVLNEVPGAVPESKFFFRGDHEQPKQVVTPGDLTITSLHRPSADIPAKNPQLPSTGRRLALANWLTDGSHPLVARVLVNRFWLHHFGKGIVPTPGDFGQLGERPTHPELLDYLASTFMERGWKLKEFHRLILTSMTYRQASLVPVEVRQRDPENRWLARYPIRRVDAESLRDAILQANGQLLEKMGGPAVSVAETVDGQIVVGKLTVEVRVVGEPVESVGAEEFRRSIYIQQRRKWPLAILDAFDMPVMNPNCEARRASTVAPQSLFFLNNEFILTQSKTLADRLLREHPGDRIGQVNRVWRLLFGTLPTDAERSKVMVFLGEQVKTLPERDALASLCQTLLASNRFLYID